MFHLLQYAEKGDFMMFKISGIKSALRSGKWLKNEEERQRLIGEIKTIEAQLMKDVLSWAKPFKTKIVDHRASQGVAFLELAAILGIDADRLLSNEYVDDALYQEIMDVIEYKPSSLQYSQDKAKLSAAILLIELSQLPDADDHIHQILAAYPSRKNFTPSSLINPYMKFKEETDLIQWYFWRLWKIIDDQRVVDFLIKMLDQDTQIVPPGYKTAIPGPGYHAAELLLIHGEERGIAALVPALLNPKKSMHIGHGLISQIFLLLNEPGTQFSGAPIPQRGQIALLAKNLKEALRTEDKENRIWVAFALARIRDNDALNLITDLLQDKDSVVVNNAIIHLGIFGDPQVIPVLLNFLTNNRMQRSAKTALNNLKSVWSSTPFIEALGYKEKNVRLYAIHALGELRDNPALTALNALMEDSDRKVRKEAKKVIKNLQK